MKSDKQAHTYGSNFSNFGSFSKPSAAKILFFAMEFFEETIEDFKLMAKVDGRAKKVVA
jgi:hypothetical protein